MIYLYLYIAEKEMEAEADERVQCHLWDIQRITAQRCYWR